MEKIISSSSSSIVPCNVDKQVYIQVHVVAGLVSLSHSLVVSSSFQLSASRRKTVQLTGLFSDNADSFPTSPLINASRQRRATKKVVTFDCASPVPFQPVFNQFTFEKHLESIQVRMYGEMCAW